MSYELLSIATFHRLRELVQQIAQEIGNGWLLTSEQLFLESQHPQREAPFTLLISEPFTLLLQGELAVLDDTVYYRVSLTFGQEAIAPFLQTLLAQLPSQRILHEALQQVTTLPQVTSSYWQSQLVLRIAAMLSPNLPQMPPVDAVLVHPALCQPAETAIAQQIEQEQLLNKMMTQIRQSLELPVILQTAVEQAQQFLQVDRMVVYQLNPPATKGMESCSGATPQPTGCIAYEAIASKGIASVLGVIEDCCFSQHTLKDDLFFQGYTLAVEDIESHYAHVPCLLTFLRQMQVRAKLIAPILVQAQLWGLLIGHQCQRARQWQDHEQKFLQRIAEHVAIAIHQAQLYSEVQQQKNTLEARVIERTQELRDALLAAQTASKVKSDFLGAVSHELRTPLTHIVGMSSTLLRWGKDSLNERQRRFLQTIHNSGQELSELINHILELSQLEAGKALLNLTEFSLSHLAQRCLRIVQEKATSAGIELIPDLQVDGQSDRFMADPRRVQQILLNLLTNAIKFTPRGGKVTLRVFASANLATLQVKDTGIGIAEQQRSLLFQKFQQLDPSYHRQYDGMGLGLALTKQLVDLHGGWIEVESTVNVGSVFTVYLPASPGSPVAVTPVVDPELDYPLGRIVLLENHEETAHIICDLLNAAGFQLIWMIEGSMALTQIEILQPLAVLTSTRLPDSIGNEIIGRLRQNPGTKKIKILALIPADTLQDREQCLAAGADDYLIKPIHPEQLMHKIRAVIKNENG